MTASEALRHSRIALNHGSGAIPVVGFGTLIPDRVATKQGDYRNRRAGAHVACSGRSLLGGTARQRFPDHLDQTSTHSGEL
jgi:hypothetical protein